MCATLIEAESLYHLGAGHCEEGKCNFVLYVAMDQISDVFYMWKDSGTDRGSREPQVKLKATCKALTMGARLDFDAILQQTYFALCLWDLPRARRVGKMDVQPAPV